MERKNKTLLNTPSPALRASSPSRGEVNGGFTLIELLVVVLIIGILAAVAVPQYQKAVEKSKAAQVLPLLKTIQQAYDAYYIANGTYPTSWNQLDATLPWTGYTQYIQADTWPVKSNEDWSMQLSTYGNMAIWLGRISGPYTGAGFVVFYTNSNGVPTQQIVCVEGKSENSVIKPFTKTKGDYCAKLFAAKEVPNGSANRYFTLK